MNEQRVLEIFKETGVLHEGHFMLTSGRHSDKYMQCARLFQRADLAQELCEDLAKKLPEADVVIGPAVGAIQMAYEVSRHKNCRNIFAERENGKFTLRRSFTIEPGERVVVVEDAVTTGGSVMEVIGLVREHGGILAGVGCIVDRSGGKVDFGVPFSSVLSLDIVSWEQDDCPLCKNGVSITKPGSRNR